MPCGALGQPAAYLPPAWEVLSSVCTPRWPLRLAFCLLVKFLFYFMPDWTQPIPSLQVALPAGVPSQGLSISVYPLAHKGIKLEPLSSKLTNVNG